MQKWSGWYSKTCNYKCGLCRFSQFYIVPIAVKSAPHANLYDRIHCVFVGLSFSVVIDEKIEHASFTATLYFSFWHYDFSFNDISCIELSLWNCGTEIYLIALSLFSFEYLKTINKYDCWFERKTDRNEN